jgi:hypothetical protein
LLSTFVSGTALANGRYPIANQLVVSPADATHLTLRTTFGLVLSEDQGKSFGWVCEKAAGFVNNEDPPVEVTADGSILVASSQALSVSHDGGCAWQQLLPDLSIVDADVDASNPKRAVAIASLYTNGMTNSGLEETLDNGNTWAPLGNSFAGLPATVAIAPSAPNMIYASGTSIADLTPLVSMSNDDGKTWQQNPIDMGGITVPFIAAVDPTHPGTVYVRGPTAGGTDALIVSTDFGVHWQALFQAKGGLYGFALSPDGTQIAVGGPSDVLSVASSADYQFKAVGTLNPVCLKWSAQGLYACADEANFGFSLGLSQDSGAHFDALFHKPDLKLKVCPSSTPTGLYCPQAWVGEQALLGIDAGVPDSGMPASGGASNAGAGSGGSGNEPTDAGIRDAAGGGTTDHDASVVPVANSETKSSSGGCAVSVCARRDSRSAWCWFALALACAEWRRRRK